MQSMQHKTTSRLPGFFKLPPAQRLERVSEIAHLDHAQQRALAEGGADLAMADLMIENVIGLFTMPLGLGVNLTIDGQDVLVPMVVEEPSVVAAVSNVGRLSRQCGGFSTEADPPVMMGQVEIPDVPDPATCLQALRDHTRRLQRMADSMLPELRRHGGGFRGLELRLLKYDEPGQEERHHVVLDFFLDCADAMGANMINTVAEALGDEIEAITGLRVGLRILSNLADRRLASAGISIPFQALSTAELDGSQVARQIAAAYRFAWADPYRAATHNKGIMNGIDAVALATGNDWRALEAGAHAYAARTGTYRPLSSWRATEDGHLVGRIRLPMAVGIVGGATRSHPAVRANLKIMGLRRATELARIMAAVGLAQNLGALKALATTGIQRGHMRLHARNVAVQAGARGTEIPLLVNMLSSEGDFSLARATVLLQQARSGKGSA